jgi:uncharacterized membrane protein YsdA (DUF1294 family)
MSEGHPLLAIVSYLVAINALTALAFVWDKHCARNNWWRVPERTLLMLAAIGGTIGAVASMKLLRHKTYKEPFRARLRVIVVLQVIAVGALVISQLWQLLRGPFGEATN